MTLLSVRTRALTGLGVVVFASAVFFPVWANVGFSHIGHWHTGPAQEGWQVVVGPVAGLTWALFMAFMMTGWTAHAVDPFEPAVRRVVHLAFAHLMAFLGALPGAFWFARVGDLAFIKFVSTLCVYTLPALFGSALVMSLVGRVDRRFAHCLGLGLGGGIWYWFFSYGR